VCQWSQTRNRQAVEGEITPVMQTWRKLWEKCNVGHGKGFMPQPWQILGEGSHTACDKAVTMSSLTSALHTPQMRGNARAVHLIEHETHI
jgi:hypothetical protein